jgi:two-component system cell cycle sensor histidine kinase/response regulator CckA
MASTADERDRSRAQQALVESDFDERESRYRALLDSALDCIIWTDECGRIEEFNHAAERTFRLSRAKALGQDLSETILPVALRPHLRGELFSSVASSGIELVGNRLETKVMRSGGGEFPAELTVTSAVIKGKATFIIYVRDLTARLLAEQALMRLAAIVESSQDAIIGTDLNCQITSWNKGAEEIYGYTAEEAIGQDISLIVPPEKAEEAIRIREQSRSGNHIQSFETTGVAKGGRRVEMSLTVSPVLDSDGIVVGASAIGRDITAYKRTQDALHKASQTSIYASPVPIVAVDDKRCITMWNPAAQAVFGWSEAEVMGKTNPITLRGGTEETVALHQRALAGETLTGIEVHGRKKDGSVLALSLSATALLDEQQKIKGIIGFLVDITEIKQAEEALRKTEQKYRTIFENAIEGIYQVTPQGKYISANPAMAKIFGFASAAELIEQRTDVRTQQYVHPEMHEEFVSTMRRSGVVQNFEYQAYREDKKAIWVAENARCVRGPEGQILYFEGSVQDVTERRDLEQQLRLMQKIEAVGRLAGGVAHDFNNLLMAVSSYAELLQLRMPEGDQGRKYLEEIVRVVDRGAALTQGLLTFSRKQVVSPKVLDMNAVIKEQLKMLRRLVPENIELKFTPGSDLGRVKADGSQIEQVVMNLVINARDAMADGGQMLIDVENAELELQTSQQDKSTAGKYVMVAVSDNGCGMDAATKAQIFEPFFTTKAQGKGTGLGLAIVSDIVKQNGGQIFVQSEVGLGTTFKVYLPRVDAALQEQIAEANDESFQACETILLVEDEDTVRESISEYLKQKGYHVLKANGGPQALLLASQSQRPIDLVLTDVIMPQMSGPELAERIKSLYPAIKTVFMSGYSNNLLSNRQILDPSHVLLQKPVRLTALAKCLRETLRRTQAATAGQ